MDNALYTGESAKEESRPPDYFCALVEVKTVLKPGGTIYLSGPFGQAGNHRWFQVFDQAMVERMIETFKPKKDRRDYFLHHAGRWCTCKPAQAAEATVFDVHSAKGYDVDSAAAARAVFCLELRK